jgi:type II secretory pathway component GspD/PulD (secretin)
VARASINGWLSVAVSVALGAGAVTGRAPVLAGTGQESGRAAHRPSQVHAALNSGIDCYRRAEFEMAARYFQQAEQGKDQLSADEKQELASLLRLNGIALKARHDGTEQVRQAEEAMKAGYAADVEALLKTLATNQYLSADDQERAAALAQQLGVGPMTIRGQSDKYIHPLLLARGKLQQARQLMTKGDFDAAQALAQEAEKLDAAYHSGEDTPKKVMDDIARHMRDPKKVLLSARMAFQNGNLDQAEKLAKLCQNLSGSSWAMPQLFGDSPAKIIKDVQTVRARLAKAEGKTVEASKAPPAPPQQEPSKTAAAASPTTSKTVPSAQPASPRQLVKLGRSALERGDLDQANDYLNQALAQKHSFNWWEDTPTKLATDIRRASSKTKDKVVAKNTTISLPTPAKETEPNPQAVAILTEARGLFAAGRLDEAEQRAQEAHAAGKNEWAAGESPEHLLTDIRKARQQRDRDEATRMLTQARKLYEKGDFDTALALAQGAEKTHGFSGADRLVAEIKAAQAKRTGGEILAPGPANRTQTAAADNETTPVLPPLTTPVQAPVEPDMKAQARQLLADARQLQKQGHLVEARMKALEAQRMGGAFGPTEDQPERALLQLADQANKRIEMLQQKATDMAATALADNNRYQIAEAILVEARQLAVGFALDTHPVDSQMSWVHRTRDQALSGAAAGSQEPITQTAATAPAPLPAALTTPSLPSESAPSTPAPLSPAPSAPVIAPGQELLDKARLELKRGELETARRLAVEVYNGPYGLKAQADSVLHSIDAEEFNRKIHTAHRTFEAGVAAFVNRNHAQAANVLRSVDVGLLPPDKQAKLKELLASPEMQPGALAHQPAPAAADVPADSAKPGPVEPPPTTLASQPAANESDSKKETAPEGYAKQVQALQEVQFQKLRDEGLKAMRDATARFRENDTVQAINILQDYLNSLEEVQFETDRLALLQRPVESRLQGFKKLKAEMDLEKERTGSQQAAQNMIQREAQLEAHKKQQVEELMKKHHQYFSEGKYAEAEMAAAQAYELDPENATASAAMHVAKMKKNVAMAAKIKSDKANMFLDGLNDAEQMGPPATSKDPLKYDDERWATAKGRKEFPKAGWSLTTKSEKELEIERKLSLPISLDFKDQTLRHVLDDLRDLTGINIVPDMPALEAEKISLDRPITMHLEGVTTKSALNLILHHAKLIYVIKDEVLLVTTEAHARGKLVSRSYQVADLVIPVENHPLGTTLSQQIERINSQQGVHTGTSPYLGGNTLRTGTNVSSPGAGATPVGTGTGTPNGEQPPEAGPALHELLIKLITTTIKPESWSDMGGPGTIQYWPLTMALVINQTPDIQEQVAELLAALRRLQDVQVAVEVRFISLSEAFYERIGLDFNVNVLTRNTKWEPLIASQQFQQAGFLNTFRPSNFVTGLVPGGTTPPGAFTHDLNIPIINSSFAPAIPPFGGFPNSLGLDGGLSLGLAFLSDIQVFMFLEAAQADRRTNVMQAPKLTLFNGQTSTIQIDTQQFFVTNIQAWQINGQVIYAPQNQAFPLGASLAIQAVISADRRYVRLNMNPILTNLASPVTALFPITAFITPVFDNGVQGQPIPFTQYVQQPTFSRININTTVLVPDGGTVIMGGLKTLREGRNEFGPPILSKLPYVSRLFKNVGYGKETESLLIMVTPRVIINEEEEAKLGTGEGFRRFSGAEGEFLRGGFRGLQEGQ